MNKPVKESVVTTTLERELGRLRRVHLMQLLRTSKDLELSVLATELLRVVVEAETIRASDLANTLSVTKTSISRYVNEMLDDGLLVQRSDPSDGRATLLSVSAVGRRALEERQARRGEILNELCGGWPKGDVETLTTLLQRLNDASQKRRMEQRARL
ncbi:MAG TPA: MarR family transcriptional regulator [Acidimicrobiales bacterium]